MSLKAKIEAVIYASEEPVSLQQFVGLLGVEAQAELDAAASDQGELALGEAESHAGTEPCESGGPDTHLADGRDVGTNETAASEETPADSEPTAPPTDGSGELTRPEQRARDRRLREYMRSLLDQLVAEYRDNDRGLEIREIAGGFRFATKPEFHDTVRGFVRSLKPPLKLSLQALETLAVVAYKQPVTAPEISEIRGVDSAGVLGSLIGRKLVATAGRKQVIGRPILYRTTKEFLIRFGLKDVEELAGIEEFERLAADMNEAVQEEMSMPEHLDQSRAGTAAGEAARALEPMRGEHAPQADGIPDDDPDGQPDAESLVPAPDSRGEFTGDATVPPADNTSIDGRISGVPPTYDEPEDGIDSPALDAEIQGSEQLENAGSDD